MAGMKTAAMTTAEEIEGMDLHELAAVPWASESVRYALRCAERGYLLGVARGLVRDARLGDRARMELESRIAALEAVLRTAPEMFELTERGRAVLAGARRRAEVGTETDAEGTETDAEGTESRREPESAPRRETAPARPGPGADPEDVEAG